MQPPGAEWLPKGCCSPQNAAFFARLEWVRKRNLFFLSADWFRSSHASFITSVLNSVISSIA